MPTTWIERFAPQRRGKTNARGAAAGTLIALVSACSSLEKDIPQDGPDMATIYHAYTTGAGGHTPDTGTPPALAPAITRPVHDTSPPPLAAYTRDAATELDNLFHRLPNPTLFMYTRPHVVGRDGIPVPGYTTAFTLYARDHAALPGEVLE